MVYHIYVFYIVQLVRKLDRRNESAIGDSFRGAGISYTVRTFNVNLIFFLQLFTDSFLEPEIHTSYNKIIYVMRVILRLTFVQFVTPLFKQQFFRLRCVTESVKPNFHLSPVKY